MTASGDSREDVTECWPEGIDCCIDFQRLHSLERMKRGGFAVVYRARLDGRDVAVKVLQSAEQVPSKLFIQEAAVLRMLQHRGVVEFLGVCTVPRGCADIVEAKDRSRLAIIEEFLEGGSLKNMMLRQSVLGPSYFPTVLEVMIDVAEAVNYLHGFHPRILHRDLTPDNILITRRAGKIQAKLVDFGLVTLIGENDEHLAKLGMDSLSTTKASVNTMPTKVLQKDRSLVDVISVSSVDTWRVCNNRSDKSLLFDGPRLCLSQNHYGHEEDSMGRGMLLSHGLWGVEGAGDGHFKWWTDAKNKVSNFLGHHRHSMELPRGIESAVLKAGYIDSAEGPHSGLRNDGAARHERLARAAVCMDVSVSHEPSGRQQPLRPLQLTGQTGSFMYMAPEIYESRPYFETADTFSFGTILYEVFSGMLLLVTHTDIASARATITYARRVALGYRPTMPKQFPLELSRLIIACWHPNPSERPLFPEVLYVLKEMRKRGTIKTMVKKKVHFFQKLCGAGHSHGPKDASWLNRSF